MSSPAQDRTDLGTHGVWRPEAGWTPELAAEVERQGWSTAWVGGSPPADLRTAEALLDATTSLVVATGIVNMWDSAPEDVAASYHRITARHPGRFVLGVGIGHPEATATYRKPYATVVDYLDRLDAAGVPVQGRLLAALGPKVLEVAGRRTAGAHPYFTTPVHTRSARVELGDGPVLAPEQKVVLETDAETARAIARPTITFYLGLTNYTSMLRRIGFGDDDLAGDGSDRLVDALAPHGTPVQVADALRAHLDAGADHVCVQLLTADDASPVPGLASLAQELGLTAPAA